MNRVSAARSRPIWRTLHHVSEPLRITLRVKPGSKREGVQGRWCGPLGEALVVAVRAPATEGKANKAVCAALAAVLGVRARDVTVVRGMRGRDKIVEIEDPPEGTRQLVRSLLDRSGGGA